MANGRNPGRGRDTGRDPGGFVALPLSVLDSAAYRSLSHPARSLLIDIARQFIPGKANNGQLLASMNHLAKRGWRSADVVQRAKCELLDARLIHETVKGARPNRASWFALTWRSLDAHAGYDPEAAAAFVRGAYRLTKIEGVIPGDGIAKAAIVPRDGIEKHKTVPRDGTMRPVSGARSIPSGGHLLEVATLSEYHISVPTQRRALERAGHRFDLPAAAA